MDGVEGWLMMRKALLERFFYFIDSSLNSICSIRRTFCCLNVLVMVSWSEMLFIVVTMLRRYGWSQ